jgi:hypothetical protein
VAEWLELDLEPGAVFVVKVAELDEGVQGLARSREGPVSDHVEFRLRRAVAVTGEIVADIFDALLEEVTFIQFQREAVLLADKEDAFKVIEYIRYVDSVE